MKGGMPGKVDLSYFMQRHIIVYQSQNSLHHRISTQQSQSANSFWSMARLSIVK